MRERPLSITIIGWINIVMFPVAIGMMVWSHFAPVDTASEPAYGLPQEALDGFSLLVTTLTLLCAVMLLRGESWARTGYLVGRVADLTTQFVFDPFVSLGVASVIFLGALVEATFLYLPRANAFFRSRDEVPPLTYQAGTAICYCMTVFFLVMAIFMGGMSQVVGSISFVMGSLLLLPAVLVFGIGNAMGLVLNPKRDAGAVLVASAGCSVLMALLFTAMIRSESWAGTAGENAPALVNPWIMSILALLAAALGAGLIRDAGRDSGAPENSQTQEPRQLHIADDFEKRVDGKE